MPEISLIAAFLAGLLSFVSPCVLPIVPFFLTYLTGSTLDDIREGRSVGFAPVKSTAYFALGMMLVFVLMGASASALGQAFASAMDYIRVIAALLIAIMGLHFLDLLSLPILNRQISIQIPKYLENSRFGAFLIGFAFAFGWSPCVGPILSVILFSAADSDNVSSGIILLTAYGFGMTLPFILASFFAAPALNLILQTRQYLGAIKKVMGVMLLIFAILIGTNSVRYIANFMLELFPSYSAIG